MAIFWAVAACLSLDLQKSARADDFEWKNPVGGFYFQPTNWNRLTGTSSAPPGNGDKAIFNEAGVYSVNFLSDKTCQDLEVVAGGVTFRSAGADRTYSLTGEAVLEGGELVLGVADDALSLSLNNDLRVQGGSRLGVLHGSVVDVAGQLRIGANFSGSGTVYVTGTGSMLSTSTQDSIIGQAGSSGTLRMDNSAVGLIGGDLNIAVSGVTGSSGEVSLHSGSTLTIEGDVNLATGSNTNQEAVIFANASSIDAYGEIRVGTGTSTDQTAFLGASFNGSISQLGNGTIDIGGPIATGNQARLVADFDSEFVSGTGAITVHPSGSLELYSAGRFIANGPLLLENGASCIIDGDGTLEAKAGFDNSADATIELRDGTLLISGGNFQATPDSVIESFRIAGETAEDTATVVVTDGATTIGTGTLWLGSSQGGEGKFRVENGGEVTCAGTEIALGFGAQASVTITGPQSSWTATWASSIADWPDSNGSLSVLAGGEFNSFFLSVGGYQGDGRVRVSGVGSRLDNEGRLTIGNVGGLGSLSISSNATVSTESLRMGSSDDTATYGGVFLFGNGQMLVSGDAFVGGSDTEGGAGTGELWILEGHVEVGQTLKIWSNGEVELDSDISSLFAGSIDNSDGGNFLFPRGTLQTGSFIGDLVNQSGTLAPGPDAGTTAITGNYTQQSGAILEMELGGSVLGTHDLVTITDAASIDGELKISLINGFVPVPVDEIVLVNADSINGFFDNVITGQRLDVAGGQGSFVVHYGFGSAFPTNQIVLTDFMSSGPVVVAPDTFTVTRGNYVSGNATDLTSSDNSDLSLRRSNSDIQSRTEFEVKGISLVAAPSSLEFTLEGAVFARSNVVQTIELFDYTAAAWELVDTRNAARSPSPDSVVTVAATGDLSRFVEPATMCVEARVRYQSNSPRQRFASNTDQTVWMIE